MHSIVVTTLLLFPWLLAAHIALGAFCETRRRGNVAKPE
jgi:hypothetical protein